MHFDLMAITFCQGRPGRLGRALQQMVEEVPAKTGLSTVTVLVPDRPHWSVQSLVNKWGQHERVIVHEPTVPVLSAEHGKQWTTVRNEALQAFDDAGHTADWSTNWDDDWQFGPGWDDPECGLAAALKEKSIISWRLISLFLWARTEGELMVNTRQRHNSPLIARYDKGWRRDPQLENGVCKRITDRTETNPHCEAYLPFFLLESGCVVPEERQRMFKESTKAGRFCRFVKTYIEAPHLEPLQRIYKKFKHPIEYWNYQVERERAEQT